MNATNNSTWNRRWQSNDEYKFEVRQSSPVSARLSGHGVDSVISHRDDSCGFFASRAAADSYLRDPNGGDGAGWVVELT